MDGYGRYKISWFGLVLLLLVICIFIIIKNKNKRSGIYKFTVFCIIVFSFCIFNSLPAGYPGQAWSSDVISTLRSQRDAVQDYIRAHGKAPTEENILVSLVSYFHDKDEYLPSGAWWMVPYTSLRVTPNAVWIGLDLAECVPVETFWERIWEGRVANLVIREGLEKRAARVLLYGSKNVLTPPESDDEKSLYKAEDDAIWLLVD